MYTISISHKTVPLEIRQLFAFTKEEEGVFITSALNNNNITSCVLLNTCNRVEVYFDGTNKPVDEMEALICAFKKVPLKTVIKYFNIYQGKQAISHLFKVAGGIDSMLVGEDEILGQVKDAFSTALNLGATDFCINTIFKQAITAAKKVKTQTCLSSTSVSLGTLAANAVFAVNKEKKDVLIIGINGKMGTIVAKNLLSKGNIIVHGTLRNHNMENQLEITYNNFSYVNYSDRYKYIKQADVIISATSSPHYTITAEEFLKHASDTKPRLLIDLAVPADIDIALGSEANVTLYNMDYFATLATANNIIKAQEAETADTMLANFVDDTLKELAFHSFLPQMENLNKYFEQNTITQAMYKLRKLATNQEMTSLITAFNKLMKTEE